MPEEQEKFNFVKWLRGLINPVTWSKSVIYCIMIMGIVFACITIYRAWIAGPRLQKTNIRVSPGGIANVTNIQRQEEKRAWWLPVPYISVYGETRNSAKNKPSDLEYGYGAQAGLRLDF